MKNIRYVLFVRIYIALIAAFLFCVPSVHAARLILETPASAVTAGDEVMISVYLDTENETLNAFEGKIIYPENFDFVSTDDGNSLVNLWVRQPERDYFGIFFSGITPGGYYGNHGKLFNLKLKAVKAGIGEISLTDISILKNDGLGTAAAVTAKKISMTVNEGVAVPPTSVQNIVSAWQDMDQPENFVPTISNSPYIFDNKWFISFNAQDKGSGISHYEKKSAKSRVGLWFARWKTITSPYLLSDQNLQSRILIKAIDNAGNKRVVEVAPTTALPWYKNLDAWLVIIAIIIITAVIKLVINFFQNKFRR